MRSRDAEVEGEWVSKSLVYNSDKPRDLEALATAIISKYGQCSRSFALSSCKFILTFPTLEQMEAALNKYQELDNWFTDILSPTIQVIRKPQYPSPSPHIEAMDSSDGVIRRHREWIASSDDTTQSDLKEGGTHIVDLDVESTELLGFQDNSNEELAGDSPNCSSYSVRRTKTISFSQHGHYEEMIKFAKFA
ncbi:LOW QUALITY PROTEIN: hypothetical protein Cgig2_001799 [Carnegiea gigantea]|uniref:Uncharacterized protein n=1 Tax=Carnegiea gigantea TaxID=171969 RepID=A0A9Q1KEG7_9CARY|nr:LOW QUALITY PROTEIN: hypothetical protein Cgig2_001799 [Carnegiea gigantea]